MARTSAARKSSAPPAAAMRVVGEVKMVAIDKVQPNTWNPNEFTPHLMASLKHGLKEDGWLISQSMLIWGKDEKGKQQNLIIDGEHRWLGAKELGFTEAPMVFLDGLTAAKAKALTIKLDAKRGKFGALPLTELLHELVIDDREAMALDFGFELDQLNRMLDDNSSAFLDDMVVDGDARNSQSPSAIGMRTQGVATLSFTVTLEEKTQILDGLNAMRGDGTVSQALVKLCTQQIKSKRGSRERRAS